jgi:hypothetical protein
MLFKTTPHLGAKAQYQARHLLVSSGSVPIHCVRCVLDNILKKYFVSKTSYRKNDSRKKRDVR